MPVENAQFINTLNPVYPAATDAVAQADDHIRLIKQVLKDTFPNLTGAVTATQGVLNSPFPVGGIIMWSGATNAIPSGWALCNGQTVNRSDGSGTIVTPDMRDRFVVGWTTDVAPGVTGGETVKTINTASGGEHSHTGSTSAAGDHNHGGSTGSHVLTVAQMPSHTHTNRVNSGLANTGGGSGTYPAGSTFAAQAERGVRSTAYNIENNVEIQPSGSNEGHAHSIGASGSHTHNLTIGLGGAHVHAISLDVRPKYFTVAYLMKV